LSLTCSNADHRLATRSGDIDPFTRVLAKRLGAKHEAPIAAFPGQRWIGPLAADLQSANETSLVIPGEPQPGLALLAACALFLVSCSAGSMTIQPYNRPLSASDFFPDGRSACNLVPGTVPQTDKMVNDPALTGSDQNGAPLTGFTVPVTNDLVSRGQERFGIYCMVCHGEDGHGDGKAVTY